MDFTSMTDTELQALGYRKIKALEEMQKEFNDEQQILMSVNAEIEKRSTPKDEPKPE